MTSYMKRIKDKIQLACLAVLTVGMVACSQDELISPNAGGEGTPVTFSATGLPMGNATATRASGDAMWSDGMTVGVMIDGEVKPYSVTPDAGSNTATLAVAAGATPFYWRYPGEQKSVVAWAPYTEGETTLPDVTVLSDQTTEANFVASTCIAAYDKDSSDPATGSYVGQTVTQGGSTALAFEHRTAKICVNLSVAQGEEVDLTGAEVNLVNLSLAPGIVNCLKTTSSYVGLIPPMTLSASTAFIHIKLRNEASYFYNLAAATTFTAGLQYVYNATLTDTGIKVTVDEAIPWDDEVSSENGIEVIETDDYYIYYGANGQRHYYVKTEAGLKVWAEYTNQGNWGTNLTLMNNITMTKPEDGSSNWTPIGYRSDGKYSDKYAGTIEGNGYTIDNMVVNTFSSNFAAMIVTLSGTVQNLTIGSGSYFHAKYWSASVTTNVNGGKVINCHSAATVNLTLTTAASWGDGSIGGIVANNRGDDGNSYVIGCSFSGQLTADAGSITESIFVGGVVGSSWTTGNGNDVQVIGCLSSGEVTLKNSPASAQTHVGGIVGSCYKNGDDITRVASCAMTGKVKFDNVYKHSAEYSAFDAGVGHLYNSPSAMYVYWSDGSIEDTWRNPYRSTTYSSVLEVNGTDIDWATATERMNSYIASWNSSWGNRCTVHFEQTGNNPPTLVQGKP